MPLKVSRCQTPARLANIGIPIILPQIEWVSCTEPSHFQKSQADLKERRVMLRTLGEQASGLMQAAQLIPCKTESVSRTDGEIRLAPASHIRGGLPPRTVRRISEYIDNNIEQRITVQVLAELASLSVSYFVRAFKRSIGITPHEYLMRRRVQLTIQLLSATDMPLSEIAHAAGFVDQSHCARRFRKHVGMSPRDYRWFTP